jgi:hypothetical protein
MGWRIFNAFQALRHFVGKSFLVFWVLAQHFDSDRENASFNVQLPGQGQFEVFA